MGSDWLEAVPEPQRDCARLARALVEAALPPGYALQAAPGMLTWAVPPERHRHTYNGQPLAYVALAARRTGCALYLTGIYVEPEAADRLRAAYSAAGRRLDLGKSCLRFRRFEDLHAEAVSAEIARLPVDAFIDAHEAARARPG